MYIKVLINNYKGRYMTVNRCKRITTVDNIFLPIYLLSRDVWITFVTTLSLNVYGSENHRLRSQKMQIMSRTFHRS